MTEPNLHPNARQPTLVEALIPVGALIIFIAVTMITITKTADGTEWGFSGDVHVALILAAAVACIIGIRLGLPWKEIQDGIVNGISIGMSAILILMVIGIMIGTWIACGTVPLLIYYGLHLLTPSIFLIAACVICCIVSLSTGSSWTTAGTVGVALIGVGHGLNVPLPMVAGAIVSGAYFGDKLSPLSDSTNLAPAVAGSELFEHIRHMLYTTGPALIIALALYGILGMFVIDGDGDPQRIEVILSTLKSNFKLHAYLLLPPVLIILMVTYKVPALPALLGGAIVGGLLAISAQGMDLKSVLGVAQDGYTAQTGITSVDELLTRGGLQGMMYTVSLVLCALSFGGIMERTGMLAVIAHRILAFARSTGSLVVATIATCIGMNILAADQYLSIIVPGRMYGDAYRKRGLHPKNLSRTLEDSGTLTSALIPWNTCGAYMATTLGVATFSYAPYAFLNLACPLVAIFLAFVGWKQAPLPKAQSSNGNQ